MTEDELLAEFTAILNRGFTDIFEDMQDTAFLDEFDKLRRKFVKMFFEMNIALSHTDHRKEFLKPTPKEFALLETKPGVAMAEYTKRTGVPGNYAIIFLRGWQR